MFLGLTQHQWGFIGLLTLVLGIAIGGLMWIFWESAKIVDRIRAVEKKANEATTLKDVETIWLEMQVVGEECWHRSLSSMVNEVAATLRAKHQILKAQAGNNSQE